MYKFHYDVMKPAFNNKLEVCFTDTDSLLYCIYSNNIYPTLEKIKSCMDFSNYPKNHYLYSEDNKKTPGRLVFYNNYIHLT